MKTSHLEKLRQAAEEWAQVNNVEASLIEVKYSGIGSNVHVLVVARKGFENWRWSARERNLIDFLRAKVNPNGDFFISRLETMTEEEYEKYEDVEA
jgi:hypothetical protein